MDNDWWVARCEVTNISVPDFQLTWYIADLYCDAENAELSRSPTTYLSTFENFPGVESARHLVSDILPIARGCYK